MRAVYITSTPAPYQLHFAEELARHMKIEFWFSMSSTSRARPSYWQQSLPDNCRMLPESGKARQMWAVHRRLTALRPDVLWLGGDWKLPGWLAAYRWARANDVPVVVGPVERSYPGESLGKRAGRAALMRALYPSIDAFLAAGFEIFDHCKYEFPGARVYMFPYAADIERYQRHPVREPTDRVVFTAGGRMDRQMRYPEILKVFSRVCAHHDSARLAITGWGAELEECRRIVEQDDALRAHVDWKTVTSWDGVAEFYRGGDVSVMYASWGGWGLVVQETMASGMGQVCGGEVSAGRYFIQDAVNGFLVYSDDDLYRAMVHYIAHPEDVTVHGAINKRIAASSGFADKARQLLEIFGDLARS